MFTLHFEGLLDSKLTKTWVSNFAAFVFLNLLDMEKIQRKIDYWNVYAHIVMGLYRARVSRSMVLKFHGPMFLWSLVLGSTVMHPIWSKCQLREDHLMCCRLRNFLKWRLCRRCFPGYWVKVFRKHFYRTRINLLDTIQNVYKAFRRRAKHLLNMLAFYATNLYKM